ncbi:hypothetical protein ACLMJK_009393 [Lecanora helva]
MEQIEHSLLPLDQHNARKIYILHGLGDIGKTQLAIAYCRKYQKTYSAILWLNGNGKDTLLQSLAALATDARIDGIQALTATAATYGQETAEKAKAVLRWLALEGNCQWLVVFDNVDRDHPTKVDDSQAYDIELFFLATDHGSILITTRLSYLGLLGKSTQVSRVDSEQAFRILIENSHLPRSLEMGSLLTRLGGLPLAIVQAGRYIRETGTSCQKYLQLYNTSWTELQTHVARLYNYPNRSVHTTWSISYKRVKRLDPRATELLQLWAYLDHQDLWFQLLLQDLVESEIRFKETVKTLLAYSLIESQEDAESYSIHPVVHDWCVESIGQSRSDLTLLALTIVGFAAPSQSELEYWVIQRRLLPHANRYVQRFVVDDVLDTEKEPDLDYTFHILGDLYADQGKLAKAEKMYERALNGKEKVLGPDHIFTL